MDDDFKTQVRQIIREELAGLIGSSQYQFQRDAKFYDGRNIQTGYSIGTKLGTDPGQKLGFFGATPVVRQTAPTDLPGVLALLHAYGLST